MEQLMLLHYCQISAGGITHKKGMFIKGFRVCITWLSGSAAIGHVSVAIEIKRGPLYTSRRFKEIIHMTSFLSRIMLVANLAITQ